MGQKFDVDTLRRIALFESITKTAVKDYGDVSNRLLFVVTPGSLFRALGQNNANVEKLEGLLNRKIKIVEFNSSLLQFVVNLLMPLRVKDIKEEDGLVTITGTDAKTKGLMIGARAQNLRAYENIVKKYFSIKEIKVV